LFAQDVLDWAKKKFPDFLDALHYTMVESSPGLRERLQERFADYKAVRIVGSVDELTDATHLCQKQADVGHLPQDAGHQPENVIVFGNEFFDAFPVEVISGKGKLHIGVEGDRFIETFAPAASCELEFLDRYGVPPGEDERAEVTLPALEYMKRIADVVRRGFAVFIDYGYTREELLAGRQKSTVRAFRQHTLCNTPYEAPGEQDITANVNFTALRDTALTAGFEQAYILTQAELLMGIGESTQFSDAFEDTRLPQEQVKVGMQLKHLITPEGMGEVFRVLLLSKGVEKEKAAKLSGLTFAR
jgi:SAM-dependent MidA family methyltransferase